VTKKQETVCGGIIPIAENQKNAEKEVV